MSHYYCEKGNKLIKAVLFYFKYLLLYFAHEIILKLYKQADFSGIKIYVLLGRRICVNCFKRSLNQTI